MLTTTVGHQYSLFENFAVLKLKFCICVQHLVLDIGTVYCVRALVFCPDNCLVVIMSLCKVLSIGS